MGYAPRTSDQCSHGKSELSARLAIYLLVLFSVAVWFLVDLTYCIAVVCLAATSSLSLSCLARFYHLLAARAFEYESLPCLDLSVDCILSAINLTT